MKKEIADNEHFELFMNLHFGSEIKQLLHLIIALFTMMNFVMIRNAYSDALY
jgi:hypothetical protein